MHRLLQNLFFIQLFCYDQEVVFLSALSKNVFAVKKGISVDYGIVRKAGSWFSYGEQKIGQGRDAVKELLSTNKELCDEIETKLREAMKTKN